LKNLIATFKLKSIHSSYAPIQRGYEPKKISGRIPENRETGIRPVNASEVMILDDDFDRF
jgi:hypothetical protein